MTDKHRLSGESAKPELIAGPLIAGQWTMLTAGLLAGGLFLTAASMPEANVLDSRGGSFATQRRMMAHVGLLYGAVSQAVWLSSALNHRIARWLSITAVTMFIVAWLSYLNERPPSRYTSQIGGLILCQSVLFYLTRCPMWQFRSAAGTRRSAQYGVGDVLAATGAVAAVLATARAYRVPGNPGDATDFFSPTASAAEASTSIFYGPSGYWLGVGLIVVWLPGLSMVLARAICANGVWRSLTWLASAAAIMMAGVGSLSWMEYQTGAHPVESLPAMLGDYTVFAVFYSYPLLGIGLGGRLDAER